MCTGNDIAQNKKIDDNDNNFCCVCQEHNIITNVYICPSDHNICKTCYISILQMCYCKNELGEILYKCPLCRNEHMFSNAEMNNILLNLVGSSELCVKVHKLCENRNITKKCQFEKCGCRLNIVDIYTKNELDLAIKDIIHVANIYSKSQKKEIKSPRNKIQRRLTNG